MASQNHQWCLPEAAGRGAHMEGILAGAGVGVGVRDINGKERHCCYQHILRCSPEKSNDI